MSRLRRQLRPLGRLLRKIHSRRRNLLLDFDLAGVIPDLIASKPIVFRQATRADLAALLADPRQDLHREAARRFTELFESGDSCFVGLLDGRFVYRAAAVTRRWRIAGRRYMKLGHAKATIMSCFTVEDQRGQGIYPAALVAQLRLLQSNGISRVFINVEETNAASISGIQKAGFKRLGSYEVLRSAGRVRVFIDPELQRALEADPPC